MHKPLSLNEARSVCMLLANGGSPPSLQEYEVGRTGVITLAVAASVLNMLEAIPADLRRCRAMLCAELTREDGPRESVLDAIINKHEQLASELKLQAVLAELPSLAVYRDRTRRPVRGSKHNPIEVLANGLRRKA